MSIIRCVLLLAALAHAVFGADFNGKWKAIFVGPPGDMPKTVPYIVLDLTMVNGELTGMAHVGSWPGDVQISEGNVNGEDFSFTLYSDSPWRAQGPGYAASGTPKLTFSGTLRKGEIQIKMVWDSIMLYGDKPQPREYEMKANRASRAASK